MIQEYEGGKIMQEFNTTSFSGEKREVEVSLKGEAESRVDLVVKGIEQLIGSIDAKHMCNEDQTLFSQITDSLLLAIADMVGYQHYYWDAVPQSEKSINEDDELVVSDKEKVRLLKLLVEELEVKLKTEC